MVRELSALIMRDEIPEGDYNAPIRIEATESGLEISTVIVPWEWIDRARKVLEAGVKVNPEYLTAEYELENGVFVKIKPCN